MDAATQQRTGRGLLFILIAFGFHLFLSRLGGAVVSTALAAEKDPDLLYKARTLTEFLAGTLVDALLIAGVVLLLRMFGAYAQFVLAALLATFGLELLQTILTLFSPTGRALSGTWMLFDLGSMLTWLASSVALLLLLRRASVAASANPSLVASLLVGIKVAYSAIIGHLVALLARFVGFAWLSTMTYVSTVAHVLMCLGFMWLAFRARRATLGLLLDPTVTAADAYRGATGLR